MKLILIKFFNDFIPTINNLILLISYFRYFKTIQLLLINLFNSKKFILLKKADELSVVDAESPILESSMSEANKVIDSSEAHKMCTRLMQWLEVQLDARPEDLVFVQRVKELASSSQANSKTHVEIETNTEINKEKIFNCCLDSGSGPLNDLNINSNNNTNEPVNNVSAIEFKTKT